LTHSHFVVGTGPSAVIATIRLLDSGQSVTVIDPSQIQSATKKLEKKFVLKDRNTKNFVYQDESPIAHVESRGVSAVESRSLGGLSNIWGGVFCPAFGTYFESEHGITKKTYERVIKILHGNLRVEGEETLDWKNLVLSAQEEPKLVQFKPQLARDKSGEIWSAVKFWESFSHPRLNLMSGIVVSYSESEEQVNLIVWNGKQLIDSECDYLFLAAGPVGNAKIVINSEKDREVVALQDSRVTYFPLLSLNSCNRPSSIMQPEKVGVRLKSEGPDFYFQAYELSDQLISSLRFTSMQVFIKAVNKLMRYRFKLIMVFFNGQNSKELLLEKNGSSLTLSRSKKALIPQEGVFKRLSLYLWRHHKELLMPIGLKGKVGEGAHLAGPGRIPRKRVKLLGMSVSKEVLAGPVTFLSMALTLNELDDFIREHLD